MQVKTGLGQAMEGIGDELLELKKKEAADSWSTVVWADAALTCPIGEYVNYSLYLLFKKFKLPPVCQPIQVWIHGK